MERTKCGHTSYQYQSSESKRLSATTLACAQRSEQLILTKQRICAFLTHACAPHENLRCDSDKSIGHNEVLCAAGRSGREVPQLRDHLIHVTAYLLTRPRHTSLVCMTFGLGLSNTQFCPSSAIRAMYMNNPPFFRIPVLGFLDSCPKDGREVDELGSLMCL